MAYRITIEEIVDYPESHTEKYQHTDVYSQRVQELDLVAVIDAINKKPKS